MSIQESNSTKLVIIGDKGFAGNFEYLENEELSYIFPLKRDIKLINYERLISREYNKSFDRHFLYQNRPIFYYKLPEDNARQVIVYHDSKPKKN